MTELEKAQSVMAALLGVPSCWHCGTPMPRRGWIPLCTLCKRATRECFHCKKKRFLLRLRWYQYMPGMPVPCCGFCRRSLRITPTSHSPATAKELVIH